MTESGESGSTLCNPTTEDRDKRPQQGNKKTGVTRPSADPSQPVSDGDAIAELGDELGGPA